MKRNQKVLGILLSLVMVGSMVFAAGEQEITDSSVNQEKWLISMTINEGHPAVTCIREFAESFTEATNGRIQFEVYANSTLADVEDALDMTRTGTVALTSGSMPPLETYLPDFGLFSLPYVFHSWEDYNDYVHNSPKAKEMWDALLEKANLRMVRVLLGGTRCLSTKGIKPVKSPEDLKGVKIRSMGSPVAQDMIRALGGTPIPVAFGELYMALQTGVVNGEDNASSVLFEQKHYEVLDDFYRTNHVYNPNLYVMNPEKWESLSAEEQEIFTSLWTEIMVDKMNAMMVDYEKVAEDEMKKSGLRFWEQDQLDMQAFFDSADKILDDNYMTNPVFSEYIKDIRTRYNY